MGEGEAEGRHHHADPSFGSASFHAAVAIRWAVAGSLEDVAFASSLWSIKRPDYFHASVAQGYFANYSFACHSDKRWVFAAIRDFVLEYWRTNDSMVDYLFVDYLITLAIRHDTAMKEAFAAIPSNNPNCDELFKVLGKPYDERLWGKIGKETSLFKLTWKQVFPVEHDGEKTFYGMLKGIGD